MLRCFARIVEVKLAEGAGATVGRMKRRQGVIDLSMDGVSIGRTAWESTGGIPSIIIEACKREGRIVSTHVLLKVLVR